MGGNDLTKGNLDLLDDFMRYAFEHPGILDKIPQDAQIVMVPTDDPELSEENHKIASVLRGRGENVVLIRVRKSEMYPPELELLSA